MSDEPLFFTRYMLHYTKNNFCAKPVGRAKMLSVNDLHHIVSRFHQHKCRMNLFLFVFVSYESTFFSVRQGYPYKDLPTPSKGGVYNKSRRREPHHPPIVHSLVQLYADRRKCIYEVLSYFDVDAHITGGRRMCAAGRVCMPPYGNRSQQSLIRYEMVGRVCLGY